MKKKIIAATLALTLSMSMGNLVYAVEDKTDDIKATYQAYYKRSKKYNPANSH